MSKEILSIDAAFTSARFASVMREIEPLAVRFAGAGHRLFLVGGTVRDLLSNSDSSLADDVDLDATTTARPPEIKRLLQGWADTVWTQGERFGTIGAIKRVAVPEGSGSGSDAGSDGDAVDVIERVFEITTHRAEAYRDGSRKPEVAFSDDIETDLSRRDFTVNAMAIEVTVPRPVLVDPFGGANDLVARVLRTPLTATESFSDDPLRMLRAARFITRCHLTPVPDVLDAVRSMSERLAIVSAERIRDELDKLLAAPAPMAGLQFVVDTGLARHALPEVAALASEVVAGSVHPDALTHTLAVLAGVPAGVDRRRRTRWAALFTSLGPDVARNRMRGLRDSLANIDHVGMLVAVHGRLVVGPGAAVSVAGGAAERDADGSSVASWTDGEVRRLVREAAGARDEAVLLARSSAAQMSPDDHRRVSESVEAFVQRVAELAVVEDLDDLRPELDGAAVMALLGLGPGRHVGAALAFLTDLRLDVGLLGDESVTRHLMKWWTDFSA